MKAEKRFIFCLLLFPLLTINGEKAPDNIEEGHSYHGHVFNEGPRQAAVIIPGTGNVHFPVTTESKETQLFFDQGIGQLHGYWDFEAERSFRQAAVTDPDCAMTYWGMAMANIKNASRGKGFIEQALKRKDHANDKEKMFISGLAAYFEDPKADSKKRRKALAASLKHIVEKYPDDIEARAFLMRQIYQNSRKGVRFEDVEEVNQLALDIFKTNPDHPVHHYVIHLWDYRKPDRALESAKRGGPSAPAIAHMWHMPGHTYDKLKRYRETAWYQEASARVDHAHTIKYQLLPDQIHNFQHNNAWLAKTLSHLGRCEDAISLAKNMTELPRVPKFRKAGDDSTYNPSKSSWRSGRQRLKEILIRFEQWEDWLTYESTPYLAPDDKSLMTWDIKKFGAIARFESGDLEGGKKRLAEFQAELEKENNKPKKSANKVRDWQSKVNELKVYEALNSNPPNLEVANQLVHKLQKIDKSRHAFLCSRSGNHDKAVELSKQAVQSGKNQIHPLAFNVYVLHSAGKTKEARTAFDKLRHLACEADLELPLFDRLTAIAKEFGYPKDWRSAQPPVVEHDLASLGPFRWEAPLAPDFVLKDDCDTTYRLSDRKDKNTLLIFYLGKSCIHCMEQLNKFAPEMKKFEAAGIDIIAISSDTPEGLAETFAAGGEGQSPFPFPLLSDSELEIFKEYRAYDDFEKQPLHGTFLIDGKQKIRWQDISYEPFMYSDWLLKNVFDCWRLKGKPG